MKYWLCFGLLFMFFVPCQSGDNKLEVPSGLVRPSLVGDKCYQDFLGKLEADSEMLDFLKEWKRLEKTPIRIRGEGGMKKGSSIETNKGRLDILCSADFYRIKNVMGSIIVVLSQENENKSKTQTSSKN